MNRHTCIAAGLLLFATGGPALAQDSACPSAQTLGTRADAATSSGAAMPLPTGAPVAATLHVVDRVFFAVPPSGRPIARTYAGTFAVHVLQSGTWRVALDAEADIDLVQDGQRIVPLGKGAVAGGCFVQQARFSLKPGRYLLQLSSSRLPVLSLLVERTQK